MDDDDDNGAGYISPTQPVPPPWMTQPVPPPPPPLDFGDGDDYEPPPEPSFKERMISSHTRRNFAKSMTRLRVLHGIVHEVVRQDGSGRRHTEALDRLRDALDSLLYDRARRMNINSVVLLWPGEQQHATVADAIRNDWMPRTEHEPPIQYAARLRECCVSVVDLLYIVRCITWTPEGVHPSLYKQLIALDKKYFRIGNCVSAMEARGYNTRYNANLFTELLCNFCVVNARDAGRVLAHSDMNAVGALISLLCTRGTRLRLASDVLMLDFHGPAVHMDWRGSYGLFAQHNYNAGDYIVMYGGTRLEHDPRQSFETEDERLAYCSRHLIRLPAEVGGGCVDGELCWRLTDTGRFARRARDWNAHFMTAPGGVVLLKAHVAIAAGSEIFIK